MIQHCIVLTDTRITSGMNSAKDMRFLALILHWMILSGIKGVYYLSMLVCFIKLCFMPFLLCNTCLYSVWPWPVGAWSRHFLAIFCFVICLSNFHRNFCSFKLRFFRKLLIVMGLEKRELWILNHIKNYIVQQNVSGVHKQLTWYSYIVVSFPFHGIIC